MTEVRIRFQANPCWICGVQTVTGTSFSFTNSVVTCLCHFITSQTPFISSVVTCLYHFTTSQNPFIHLPSTLYNLTDIAICIRHLNVSRPFSPLYGLGELEHWDRGFDLLSKHFIVLYFCVQIEDFTWTNAHSKS